MASGFLVLPDGRCFSSRSYFHDAVLTEINELMSEPNLRHWLTEQLPGPDDTVDFGWGWLRASDQSTILRFIDLRLMTGKNQLLILDAAMRAAAVRHQAIRPTPALPARPSFAGDLHRA